MTAGPTPVGIAVVLRDGLCLVGTRPTGVPLAGRLEFPGGKCRSGESSRDAAVRECLEETGLEVTSRELLSEVTHRYEHGMIQLNFWLCHPAEHAIDQTPKADFGWIPLGELDANRFPEANAGLIARLTTLAKGSPGSGEDQTPSTHEA